MAPKKGALSYSSAVSVTEDITAPSLSSQVKKYLRKHKNDFTADIFVSLTSTTSPNALGLGLAFLEFAPNSFVSFYHSLPDEPLKYQNEIDLYKVYSSNTIRSWLIPSNEWIKWVNRMAKAKSTILADSGILMLFPF